MHVINRLSHNRPCWCQLDRNCDQQTSTTINQRCWWHRAFFRQRIVVDADSGLSDYRGGRT